MKTGSIILSWNFPPRSSYPRWLTANQGGQVRGLSPRVGPIVTCFNLLFAINPSDREHERWLTAIQGALLFPVVIYINSCANRAIASMHARRLLTPFFLEAYVTRVGALWLGGGIRALIIAQPISEKAFILPLWYQERQSLSESWKVETIT